MPVSAVIATGRPAARSTAHYLRPSDAAQRWPRPGIRAPILRMNRHRLFRTIWRVNGVLLLLTFVLLAGTALVAIVSSLPIWGGHHGSDEAPAAETAEGERLWYGAAEPLEGTTFVVLPLLAREGGYSSSEAEVRNLLFFDAASGQARWLRPDHRAVVSAHEPLRDGPPPRDEVADDPRPVRWIRYEISGAGGGETEGEPFSIAVSGPGGDDLAVVLPEVDEVLGYSPPRGGALVVFYRRGEKHFAAEIDLAARKVKRTSPLPKS